MNSPDARSFPRWWATRIAASLLLAAAIGALVFLIPVRVYLTEALAWMAGLGPCAPLAMIAAYVVASLFFLPIPLLSIGAGFLFGIALGAITVSLGSTLGATAAFVVGRKLGRDRMRRLTAGYPKFKAIDRAVGREGYKVVILSRLSPAMPYNVLNFAFGLSPIALGPYVLATWIGMLPLTIVYVYLGSTLADLAELSTGNAQGDLARQMLLALGLAATIVLAALVMRIARRALEEAADEDKAVPPPAD